MPYNNKTDKRKLAAKDLKTKLTDLGFESNINLSGPEEAKEEFFKFLIEDKKLTHSDLEKNTSLSSLFKLFSEASGLSLRPLKNEFKAECLERREKELSIELVAYVTHIESMKGLGKKDLEMQQEALFENICVDALSSPERAFLLEKLSEVIGVDKKLLKEEFQLFQAKSIMSEDLEGKPTLYVNNKWLEEIEKEASGLLRDANHEKPEIFSRGGDMVFLSSRGKLEGVTPTMLEGFLDRKMGFMKLAVRGEELIPEKTTVPNRLAARLLSDFLNPEVVPELELFNRAPFFTESSVLIKDAGYHPEHKALLILEGLEDIKDDIPLTEAIAEIDYVIKDFPFVGLDCERKEDFKKGDLLPNSEGRAYFYAALFQVYLRKTINDITPICVIEAAMQGTGKTLMCDTISRITTGKPVPTYSLPRDEDERKKLITTILLQDEANALFDNLKDLNGEALATLVTSNMWNGRKLGSNTLLNLRNLTNVFVTGNNLVIDDDLRRRKVTISLDANRSNPTDRKFDIYPPDYVMANRQTLNNAAISIISHAAKKGFPKPKNTPRYDSFGTWRNILGSVLENAGIKGFLDFKRNNSEVFNPETHQYARLYDLLFGDGNGHLHWKIKDILELCGQYDLLSDVWGKYHRPNEDIKESKGAQTALGKALSGRRNAVFDDYYLEISQDTKAGGNLYTVKRKEEKNIFSEKRNKSKESSVGSVGSVDDDADNVNLQQNLDGTSPVGSVNDYADDVSPQQDFDVNSSIPSAKVRSSQQNLTRGSVEVPPVEKVVVQVEAEPAEPKVDFVQTQKNIFSISGKFATSSKTNRKYPLGDGLLTVEQLMELEIQEDVRAAKDDFSLRDALDSFCDEPQVYLETVRGYLNEDQKDFEIKKDEEGVL